MILVTGASGLLGASLADEFLRAGRDVTGLSHSHRMEGAGLPWRRADLRDAAGLHALVHELRPSLIVHSAAWTDVDGCERSPEEADAVNALPCATLAGAANETGAILAYISTDSVFDGTAGNYREDDPVAPLNAYARSKRRGEEIVLRQARHPLVLRTNIYGWNAQPKRSLAEWVLHELGAGREIGGFSDAVFSPILANDLAAPILRLADAGKEGLYHLAGGEACSKLDFARALAAAFGLPGDRIIPARLAEAKFLAPRPLNTSLCCARVEEVIGPLPTVAAGISRFRELAETGRPAILRGRISPP